MMELLRQSWWGYKNNEFHFFLCSVYNSKTNAIEIQLSDSHQCFYIDFNWTVDWNSTTLEIILFLLFIITLADKLPVVLLVLCNLFSHFPPQKIFHLWSVKLKFVFCFYCSHHNLYDLFCVLNEWMTCSFCKLLEVKLISSHTFLQCVLTKKRGWSHGCLDIVNIIVLSSVMAGRSSSQPLLLCTPLRFLMEVRETNPCFTYCFYSMGQLSARSNVILKAMRIAIGSLILNHLATG